MVPVGVIYQPIDIVQMVPVLVHIVGLKERIQRSTIVVVEIGAEIRIRIVEVHKRRAVMTGKTQAELIWCSG